MQTAGLEWFYRFLQEPARMWKRYLFTNVEFFLVVVAELLRRSVPYPKY
jgi:N-acetylglucosaminyldiphosphoundecaprenol N-acetyl-beta-D-mannosaminyltransferase